MPTEHALLSASSAERWLHCTAAPRLEETLPDTRSEYAAEGTLAHAIAELKARKKFMFVKPSVYKAELKKLTEDPLFKSEMDSHTTDYVNYLVEQANEFPATPSVALEVRVDYSAYAPEGFGTADNIMVGGDLLCVTDFKYGAGVLVDAENNAQMRMYALGALARYSLIFGDSIKRIRMSIFQPRRDVAVSSWEISRDELVRWGEEVVKPAAQIAFEGSGAFEESEWCRFCRAKHTCRARAKVNTALEDFAFALPPTLSNTEVGDILVKAQRLKQWASDLEDYALSSVLEGDDVPGWKAVEGRSNRAYSDQIKVSEALKASGYPEAVIYKPRELFGITEMEKLVGKKNFGTMLADYIIKPPGKPTLVLATDNRPAYSSAAADFAGVTAEPSPRACTRADR